MRARLFQRKARTCLTIGHMPSAAGHSRSSERRVSLNWSNALLRCVALKLAPSIGSLCVSSFPRWCPCRWSERRAERVTDADSDGSWRRSTSSRTFGCILVEFNAVRPAIAASMYVRSSAAFPNGASTAPTRVMSSDSCSIRGLAAAAKQTLWTSQCDDGQAMPCSEGRCAASVTLPQSSIAWHASSPGKRTVGYARAFAAHTTAHIVILLRPRRLAQPLLLGVLALELL